MKNSERLRVAFYGKGGIGKSTIASNVSAAFSKLGLKVLHIGCDPKGDSTRSLIGRKIPCVLEMIQKKGNNIEEKDIIYQGFNGINCVEAGGPEAGTGCAGIGITTMIEELKSMGVLDKYWDVEVYDVLGDVACGGFLLPMSEGFIDIVYIVSSSEFMSIYSANNIMKVIKKFFESKNCNFGGIIHNRRSENSSDAVIRYFAEKSNSKVIYDIPFSTEIVLSELEGKTVIEKYPYSKIKSTFTDLARIIKANANYIVPKALDDDEMEKLSRSILEKKIKNRYR